MPSHEIHKNDLEVSKIDQSDGEVVSIIETLRESGKDRRMAARRGITYTNRRAS